MPLGWAQVGCAGGTTARTVPSRRPKALVSVLAGARLPTALTLADARRVRLDTDAQLGPGALVPLLGVAWSGFFGDRWSALVSLVGEVPFEGRYGLRMGPAAVLVGLGQLQPLRWLGVHSMYQLYRLADRREIAGLARTSKLATLADRITGH